ncbi:MAG: right-handed parallel beta-helix repeat-containing protein, partial [Zoogloeaceae bacterium]|nr:right-handed parallel beta-helix repeat-containing protein [Zoogloeaceae bacterium]
MPFNPPPTTRRRFLASFLSLAAAPAEGFSLSGKKRARDLGKIYAYLQDVDLRIKETGDKRITIKNVIFSGESFNGEWGRFDFVECEFTGQYKIQLDWLVKCTFTNCSFKEFVILGNARDVKFINCDVSTNGLGGVRFRSGSTGLVFESCTFRNSRYDRNKVGSVSSEGEISFIDCKADGFALGGYKKLVLRKCVSVNGYLDTDFPGLYEDISQMPYSDFLLEDCDFTRGVDATNLKLNNFIMRNCEVGVFETARGTVRGDMLIESIKEGHLDFSRTDFQGKLTVRNCSFFRLHDGHCFWCPSVVVPHTLIENVVCGTDPANISGFTNKMTEEKRLPVTKNKSTIIRDCHIPHLHL